MKVGLFFGSFNPIHTGHLVLAESILDKAKLDNVWFVVSPQNPFKSKSVLAHEFDRFDMVKLAIENNPRLQVSDVEFSMPKPSYTIDTLQYLTDKFKTYEFSLIIGEDNLTHFHKWKNHEAILSNHTVYVYPRPNSLPSKVDNKAIIKVEAPLMEISASEIRRRVKQQNSIKYIIPDKVAEYIFEKGIYTK